MKFLMEGPGIGFFLWGLITKIRRALDSINALEFFLSSLKVVLTEFLYKDCQLHPLLSEYAK